MSDKPTIVLSYGCPRSGTSAVAAMCRQLEDISFQKWKEISPLHPALCDNGILELSQVFSECRLIFVRSVRHPMEIVKSFYALRKGLVPSSGTIRYTSDEKILEWIEIEIKNTASQKRRMRNEHPWKVYDHHVIEAKYEILSSEDRSGFTKEFSTLLPQSERNRSIIESFLDTQWNSKSSSFRPGRLQAGCDVTMSDEKRAWWANELENLADKEGYTL
jgi:hypothetical protein